MAERDDDDDGTPRRADTRGEQALTSWSGYDGGARPSRGPRSWSQLAALDDDAPPASPTVERPREGLLSVDSGLLDLMALEAGEGGAGALPDDFDAEAFAVAPSDTVASRETLAEAWDDAPWDDAGGALPDDLDDAALGAIGEPAGGALPDDFDPAAYDDDALPDDGSIGGLDTPFEGGGALPDDFDAEEMIGGEAAGAAFAEGGALPDDFDVETLGEGALSADARRGFDDAAPFDDFGDGGALPMEFDVDAFDAGDGGVLDDGFDGGALGEGAFGDEAFGDGALPADFDLDQPIGSTLDGPAPPGGAFAGAPRSARAVLDELEARAGLDEMASLADFGDLDDLPGGDLESIYASESLEDFDDFDYGNGAIPAELGLDGLIGDDLPTIAPDASQRPPEPTEDDIALDFDVDLGSDLDDSLELGDDVFGGVIGGEGGEDDWLDSVLDEVESRQIGEADDEGWGELLDEEGDGPEPAAAQRQPVARGVEEDLWDAAAARWGDDGAAAGDATPDAYHDPFAAPVAGVLADQTAGLGDPFAPVALPAPSGEAEADAGFALPIEGPRPAEPRARATVPDAIEIPRARGVVPPDPAAVADAWALISARSAARRAAFAAAVDDPDLMVVEEVLEDGAERRIVRVEYPRLGELDILELPEDGAELPGLDDELEAPFGDEFVFFEDAPIGAPDPRDERSALDALSREPVELAALLAADAVAEIESMGTAPDGSDDSIDRGSVGRRGLANASTEAPLSIAPPDLGHDGAADIDRALDALAVDPLDEAVPAPLGDDGPFSGMRPGFAGGLDALDDAQLAALGAPFLGAIPPFEATPVRGAFPRGSLAARRGEAPGGPPVVPVLRAARAEREELAWAVRLIDFLRAEVDATADRRWLATALHGIGRAAWTVLGDEALALDALRAAADNDPGLAINRWLLEGLLEQTGRIEEAIERAGSPDAEGVSDPDRLHRAGHLALAHTRDSDAALGWWRRAVEVDARHGPSLLARYLVLLEGGGAPAIAAALDALFDGVDGAVWWSALALERARLHSEAGAEPERLDALLEEALRRRGGVPAVFAAVERHALRHGRMSVWLTALRARFDRVMADYEGGAVTEGDAQQEVGEVFAKAGLALEQLGRRAEALAEYDHALKSLPDEPYVLHRAAQLARLLGDHDTLRRHLDRLARLSPVPAERADAAYQMGLLARQLADEPTAERDFERAIKALPTFTPALAALGRLDLRRGDTEAIQERYASEIRQFEEALRQPQTAVERRRTVRGVTDRYYRLARLLEETGDSGVALDVYKRALAVDPGFSPALDAMDRIYVRHGRWRERAALILGWAQRQQGAPIEAIDPLLTAVDMLRVHLDDDANAARVAARALAIAPAHPYALRRASEAFGRIGNTAARVEVDLRWGRLDGGPPERLLRAAELQALDGDPLAAAAEALPLFREALARDPSSPAAIDGLLRTAARLGRMGEVVQQIELHDLAARRAPSIALPLADALLSAGRPDEAAAFLIRWRARARSTGTIEPAADAAALALLSLACERTDHWRALADTLEERALLSEGRPRAVLLARIGALWELRLSEPTLAEDAYRRALDADPDCHPARRGLTRLDLGDADDWRPTTDTPLAHARRADRGDDPEARTAALDALADGADDPRDAIAWRLMARGDAAPSEAAGALFAEHPERADLYADYTRRLERTGDRAALDAAAYARLDYEDEPGRIAILTRAIGRALRAGDDAAVRRAADALLALDPSSLPALLALRRLAQTGGQRAGQIDRRLTGVLRAPAPAAALRHATALEAEAHGADPDRVRGLLTQAVELNPADAIAADALAERLGAAGEYSRLVELYRRRLEALAEPEARRPVARALAAVLADRLDDLAGAFATLRRELDAEAPDVDTALAAAEYAERLGRPDEADRCHAEAAAVEGGRRPALRARAAALHRRGDLEGARALLDQLVDEDPRDVEVLGLLAEVLAAGREWKGVVQVFRRLMTLETAPSARADRAMAIAEIFARVYRDPRRAAGWFKRAVELDPQRDRAVGRLLEEVDRAPAGSVPVEHVRDALDRAVDAQRSAFAERPGDVAALEALARLHARRGDRDAQLVVGEVLWWLGAADEALRGWVEAARSRMQLDFARPLSDELRRNHLEHPGERGPARLVFDAFSLVLTEVLSGAMPAGVPRLSRRSFPAWQAEFRRLATALGIDDVELWNGGRSVVAPRGMYVPQPAVAVPSAALDEPLAPPMAFTLGRLLEGLRSGRLLLEDPGPERVGRCGWVMASALTPGEEAPADELPEHLHRRLIERARRLPRRIKLQLDALAEQIRAPLDFDQLAAAVAATRDRAGLLCCGDTRVALDALVFADPTEADAARRAGGVRAALDASPAGRALAIWALGADYARLREVLGLGLSRRPR